jgi:hypothetical protein
VTKAPIDGNTVDPPIMAATGYRLTEDDSVQAVKLDGRPSRALLTIYATTGMALFALCLVGSLRIKLVAGLALLGGIIGEAVARHVIMPALRRRSYRRNELLHNEFTIQVRDADIRIFTIKTDITLTAENITKWKEGRDHILIYVAPRVYFTIPKRLANRTFDLDTLRTRLRQYAGSPAR